MSLMMLDALLFYILSHTIFLLLPCLVSMPMLKFFTTASHTHVRIYIQCKTEAIQTAMCHFYISPLNKLLLLLRLLL